MDHASGGHKVYPIAKIPERSIPYAQAILDRRHIVFEFIDIANRHYIDVVALKPDDVSPARNLILRDAKRHGYLKFVLSHPGGL